MKPPNNNNIKENSEVFMTKKALEKKKRIELAMMKKELISSINSVIVEMENSYENYNLATGEMIDFYAYDIKAKQARYNYLREQLKNLN